MHGGLFDGLDPLTIDPQKAGAGMREYARPLEVGSEITDGGGQRYAVVRVQERETRGGFGHAWAEAIAAPD